jgi:alpha-tubulin suppressor-like RCC1 family protein
MGSAGRLGNGSPEDRAVPGPVSGNLTFRSLSGRSHACGTTAAGRTYCWGPDVWNQIGSGSAFLEEPWALPAEKQLAAIVAGGGVTCGQDGQSTWCWGLDEHGNLGAGSLSAERCSAVDLIPCSAVPRPVARDLAFRQLGMSMTATCGITVDGVLYCWGSNEKGQLGSGSPEPRSATPVPVADPL